MRCGVIPSFGVAFVLIRQAKPNVFLIQRSLTLLVFVSASLLAANGHLYCLQDNASCRLVVCCCLLVEKKNDDVHFR